METDDPLATSETGSITLRTRPVRRTSAHSGLGVAADSDSTEATFLGWVNDHRGIVVKVARSFTATTEDRDDLIQEILLRVWASVDTFRGDAKPSTFIYRIALNRAMTWRRDESKHRDRKRPLLEIDDVDQSAGPESAAQLDFLYQQLRTLNEIDRALLLLSLDGFSYRDMADITDLTETNVGARLTRARTKLQHQLTEEQS